LITKNFFYKLLLKDNKNFGSKTTIYLSLGSIKDFQATEEAFRLQKRTSSTSKHEKKKKIYFCGSFRPPGSGSTTLIKNLDGGGGGEQGDGI
jgi:hypothetical protein